MRSVKPLAAARSRVSHRLQRAASAFTLLAILGLAGCAIHALQPGARLDETRERLGRPAFEQVTAGGGRRLLYPMGLQTFALEFDTQGRLLHSQNVLTETHFATVTPGMAREQLRAMFGNPSRVWGVRFRNQTVWSYSFDDLFCRQFHVGLTPQGIVEDTSYGPDPRCEERRFFLD